MGNARTQGRKMLGCARTYNNRLIQGGGYLLGCRGSIVFDGTGIQKIRRRISFVPSDYRSIDLHALRQACVFTKHLHRQRMKFDGFSEFSTGGHSRSLQL